MVGFVVMSIGLAYHVGVRDVGLCLLVPLCCCEVACILLAWHSSTPDVVAHTNDKRVLWQLLKETLLGRSVNVEVESLCLAGQQCQTGY